MAIRLGPCRCEGGVAGIALATGGPESAPSFHQFDLAKAVELALQDPKTRRVLRFRASGTRT